MDKNLNRVDLPSTEALLGECFTNRVNVEVLMDADGPESYHLGVRLRPYGNSQSRGYMVLGRGDTLQSALGDAVAKANAGRWEELDWAKRPWPKAAKGGWSVR